MEAKLSYGDGRKASRHDDAESLFAIFRRRLKFEISESLAVMVALDCGYMWLGSLPEQSISPLCSSMHVTEILTCKPRYLLVSFRKLQQKAFPHPQKTFRKISYQVCL